MTIKPCVFCAHGKTRHFPNAGRCWAAGCTCPRYAPDPSALETRGECLAYLKREFARYLRDDDLREVCDRLDQAPTELLRAMIEHDAVGQVVRAAAMNLGEFKP